ncbi:hypothetical protein HID58_059784 [Brassica napus]|uniref:Uncharacterized protein n=3 Tax=Brassica TaxID=3705 RepID=A0ABQ7ZUH5_BRANA|nr:hypothetical protein HID58_059784 [Brassica napus]
MLYHKMTKAIILAMFMVILVLGMVTKERQGEQPCLDYIVGEESCQPMVCLFQCALKWKWLHETGECANVRDKTKDSIKDKACVCTFNCS